MKRKKRRNQRRNRRTSIVQVEQPSRVRRAVYYAATCATTACIGVGFEDLVRWAWEAIKHLF
jgi:hypothetical protein